MIPLKLADGTNLKCSMLACSLNMFIILICATVGMAGWFECPVECLAECLSCIMAGKVASRESGKVIHRVASGVAGEWLA